MPCVVEVSFEKQRLLDKKAKIEKDLAKAYTPNGRAWQRMKLDDVNKSLREYERSH